MDSKDKDFGTRVDLVASLREAVDYATTAGLLKDASALTALDSAKAAQERGEPPDRKLVSEALNSMVTLIAPLTLADLHFDRNPLSPDNQARTRKFQFWLPVLALVLLVSIGYFMQSVRQAQSFIARVERVQGQNLDQKLAALQQMILSDISKEPLKAQESMQEQYLQRLDDLQRLTTELTTLRSLASELDGQLGRMSLKQLKSSIEAFWTPPAPTSTPQSGIPPGFCEASEIGDMKLPPEFQKWPPWMQRMAADDLRNFCFKLQLQAGRLGQFDTGVFVPQLVAKALAVKESIALRSEWILPFLYGLLGSMLFMMRTVGDIRRPAMHAMSILMRIALGGMAGIVIGWFSIGEPGARPQVTSAIAWPFVLAFVAGYGIEALFLILDRLNALIAEPSQSKRDSSAKSG